MRTFLVFALLVLVAAACHRESQPQRGGHTPLPAPTETTRKGVPDSYADLGFSEASSLVARGDADVIAFGSCNKHDKPQPLWDDILEQRPDVWIWLGDAVYGDSDEEEVLRGKYDAQDAISSYQQLKSSTEVVGTWDDHDYGVNNGGKHFHAKEMTKDVFLDFVGVREDHTSRKRAGIYQSYMLGQGERQVKIILLDTRTFRDDVAMDKKKAYIPDPEADILGETQWKWLENELANNGAAITLIGNGSQVVAKEHPFEKWANYPSSRKRLFKLVSDLCPSGALLISGDRHHAEFSKANIPKMAHALYDFTSSGLTHTRSHPQPEKNPYREGKKVDELNFGIIRIDWEHKPIKVRLEIRGDNGQVYESASFEVPK